MGGFLFYLHTFLSHKWSGKPVLMIDSEEKVIKNSDVVGGDRWGRGPPMSKAPADQGMLPP